MTTPINNDHAKYPPSKLRNLELCVGYENDNTPNVAASEGTLMHKACETGDLSSLDEEQTEAVQKCTSYVQRLVQPTTRKKLHEVRLNVAGYTWGTADCILIQREGRADVVDFKFGRNSVDDAESNIQGWCYAVGVFYNFSDVDSIAIHFLLPRRDEVSQHTFTRADYENMVLRISTIIARRRAYEDKPDPEKLTPIPANCLYCARKAECTRLHAIALRYAGGYDVTFEIPPEFHPSNIQDPRQMAVLLPAAQVMERWAKSVKEHSTQMVLNGTEIPGQRLVSRQGAVEIRDAQAAFDSARALLPDLTLEEFVSIVKVSKSDLEELVRDKSPRGQKQRNSELLTETLIGNGIGVRGATVNYLTKIRD